MNHKYFAVVAAALALAIFPTAGVSAQGDAPGAPRWSWQDPQAVVDAKGDLTWKPRPFVFEKGASVRYIDFEAGDDSNSGDSSPKTSALGKCGSSSEESG